MNQKRDCIRCREIFPLATAGSASAEERYFMQHHLDGCSECRQVYEDEVPMFRLLSTGGNPHSPLADHPDVDMIRAYVQESESLSDNRKEQIRDHLSKCEVCRDMVTDLQALPEDAHALLTETTAPVLTSIDRMPAAETGPKRRSLSSVVGNPLTAYAVAAIVLLTSAIVILNLSDADRPPTAIVDMTIPASLRSSRSPAVYTTPTNPAYLSIRYPVRPEPGHRYELYLVSESDDTLLSRSPLTLPENEDNAAFTVLADTGRYTILYRDIFSDDTVQLVKPFRLELTVPEPVER